MLPKISAARSPVHHVCVRCRYPAVSPIFHTNSDHPPPQYKQHQQHQQTSEASGPAEAANGHKEEAATSSSPPAAAATSPAAAKAGGSANPPAPSASRPIIISPSILAADFANLQRDVGGALAGGAQWVHVDMFDGSFVDNFTMGFPVVASLRKAFPDAFLDCHLAVNVSVLSRACSFPSSLPPSVTRLSCCLCMLGCGSVVLWLAKLRAWYYCSHAKSCCAWAVRAIARCTWCPQHGISLVAVACFCSGLTNLQSFILVHAPAHLRQHTVNEYSSSISTANTFLLHPLLSPVWPLLPGLSL